MPDAAPAPVSNAAPVVAATTPPPVVEAKPLEAQPPAQEPVATPEDAAKKRAANIERHNKIQEQQRVKQSRVEADRKAVEAEKARVSEDIKLAAEYRRLAKLQAEDPLKYLEEVKIAVPQVSKLWLEKQTGSQKTPAQLAEEAAAAVWQKNEEARRAAEAKALEERTASEEAAAVKARSDAYASARKQMEDIAAADKKTFKHVYALGDAGIDIAWKLTEAAFKKNGNRVEGMPTWKEIVAGAEQHIVNRLKAQDEAEATAAKEVEAAAKKIEPKAKAAASLAKGTTQDGVTTPPPTQRKGRIQPIMDYRAVAKQLVEEAKAKQAAAQDT